MSYLGFPRLHFCGRFQADPSSVNNDPYHFDTAAFQPEWDDPQSSLAPNGWWNPQGSGAWRFRDCTVRSVFYGDGSYCDDETLDAVVGLPVNGSSTQVAGKLVDLDPEQQMVSQIWGFQVVLGDPASDGFSGDYETAAFADIWVRYPQGKPDSFFSATYQSILTSLQWATQLGSRFLDELGRPDRLSIKFTVDGFDDDRTSPWFTFGRVSGTIGPYADGEPHHFVVGRRLRTTESSSLNFAVALLDDEGRLSVDLGNSMPTTSAGGPLADLGRVELALLPPGADPVAIGAVSYMGRGWYEDRAGIQTFQLTPDQAKQAAATPLGIVAAGDGGPKVMLSEDAAGTWVFADDYVFRLDPGAPQPTTMRAVSFGRAAANQQIDLVIDNSAMQQQVQQGPVPGPPVGVPEGVVTEATRGAFPLSVTTGEDGTVQLDLVGSDPGNPRGYIDGQVYGVRYDWNGVDRSAFKDEPMNLISVLVWDAYELDGKPTWIEHVQPIFQQYANLYPVMRRVLDLDDYASVRRNVVALQFNFDLPVEDPNYMPVVRDLSTAKHTMIKTWLADPAYMWIDSVADLQRALQQAIELEHSTIPPYLTALFSIKDGRNREVAEIIRSIVVEEMLHMALACNLLNAVGGAPAINTAGFVPKYPTRMPGGLHPGLVVSLKKASIEHIRDVFMTIEEPEETIDPDVHYGLTIGWFYAQIEAALERLDMQPGVNLFSGDPKRQVSGWDPPRTYELFAVTNLETAQRAIREIRDQGEGASPIDPDVGPGQELAHYYKFEEIVRGRRLVVHEGGYDFTGAEIAFDPDGVWPMVDNPSTASLPSPSLARVRSEEFNEQYAALLTLLHRTFNGETDLISPAINLMWSLEVAGKGLAQTPIYPDSAETAGPSFEYPGASPAEEPKASPNQRFKPPTMKGQPVTR